MKTNRSNSTGKHRSYRHRAWLALTLVLAGAVAAEPVAKPDAAEQKINKIDQVLRVGNGHPNELHRLLAQRAYASGNQRLAAEQFRLAAGFADKFSQHRLSLMHWNGQGVSRDRVLAYVWADLAAERGTPNLLANRERIWQQLSVAEREQVGRIGPDYQAEFGDAVAKRRALVAMRRSANQRGGSYVGWNGNIAEVPVPFSAQLNQLDTSIPLAMYADERADPERYWRSQDAMLAEASVESLLPTAVGAGTRKPATPPRSKYPERLL
ncbi:MAG: hypothetical protein AB7F83_07270 [Lysobacterales bacterium]